MCFVFIREQTATCATYSINRLDFITEMKSVYSAVRTESLNKAICTKGLIITLTKTECAKLSDLFLKEVACCCTLQLLVTFLYILRMACLKQDEACSCRYLTLLNAELNPICHLLALLEPHHILHVSRIRVKTKFCCVFRK